MTDPRHLIVLEEARHAVDRQAARLDEIRQRAGLLLSAATVATAFLGPDAFASSADPSPVAWIGLCSYLATLIASLWLITPATTAWRMTRRADVLAERWIEAEEVAPDEFALQLALAMQEDYDGNEHLLGHRYLGLRWAVGLVAGTTVALLLEIATR